jgi:hypothetical protein
MGAVWQVVKESESVEGIAYDGFADPHHNVGLYSSPIIEHDFEHTPFIAFSVTGKGPHVLPLTDGSLRISQLVQVGKQFVKLFCGHS